MMKRSHPMPWSLDSKKQKKDLSLRCFNAQKQRVHLRLSRQASFSDLLSQVGSEFGIRQEKVVISTSGKVVVATGPTTLVSTILDESEEVLVESEFEMIVRRIREQEQEYQERERQAKLGRWERDGEGDFVVCSFKQWQLKKGEWGYPLVDYYWPDENDLNFQLQRFRLKRSRSQRAQKRPNDIMKEIEVFEGLETMYKAATKVVDIVTLFLQLEWSVHFTFSNCIGNSVSAFCGSPEFVCTLPENEKLLATFWSHVCTNSELLDKNYATMNAKFVANTVTEVCVEDTNAKLNVRALAFALRRKFMPDPDCITSLDSDKKVAILKEWDKQVLQFFADHGVLKSSKDVNYSTTYALRLLEEADVDDVKDD